MRSILSLPYEILRLILYCVAGDSVGKRTTNSPWATLSLVHPLFAMQKWVKHVSINHSDMTEDRLYSFQRMEWLQIKDNWFESTFLFPFPLKVNGVTPLRFLEMETPMTIHLGFPLQNLIELVLHFIPCFEKDIVFPSLIRCTIRIYASYTDYDAPKKRCSLHFAPNLQSLTCKSDVLEEIEDMPSTLRMITTHCDSLPMDIWPSTIESISYHHSPLCNLKYISQIANYPKLRCLKFSGVRMGVLETIQTISNLQQLDLDALGMYALTPYQHDLIVSLLSNNAATLQSLFLQIDAFVTLPSLPLLKLCLIHVNSHESDAANADISPFINSLPLGLAEFGITISGSLQPVSLRQLTRLQGLRRLHIDRVQFSELPSLHHLETLTIGRLKKSQSHVVYRAGLTEIRIGKWRDEWEGDIPSTLWKMVQAAFLPHVLPEL